MVNERALYSSMLSYNKDLIDSLRSLRRATGSLWNESTLNRAPYKPLLLLCVLDGIDEGWIPTNHITLSERLIERFEAYCEMIQSVGTWDIKLPFHHLASDNGLWFHINEREAKLGDELYDLLQTEMGRDVVRGLLISQYFNVDTGHRLNSRHADFGVENAFIEQLYSRVDLPFQLNHVNEPPKTRNVTQNVRNQAFRIAVRRSYDYTCAVCRSRLITPSGHILVEGAHIVPHSTSFNDDPRNGLALCRTHHWLFDRYMITIRPSHEIEIAPVVFQSPNHLTGTIEFDRKRIHLPNDSRVHPAAEALGDHNRRFRDANFSN